MSRTLPSFYPVKGALLQADDIKILTMTVFSVNAYCLYVSSTDSRVRGTVKVATSAAAATLVNRCRSILTDRVCTSDGQTDPHSWIKPSRQTSRHGTISSEIFLTCAKNLTDSELNLPHATAAERVHCVSKKQYIWLLTTTSANTDRLS